MAEQQGPPPPPPPPPSPPPAKLQPQHSGKDSAFQSKNLKTQISDETPDNGVPKPEEERAAYVKEGEEDVEAGPAEEPDQEPEAAEEPEEGDTSPAVLQIVESPEKTPQTPDPGKIQLLIILIKDS